jgi:DNA-binding NtrC family response regulator
VGEATIQLTIGTSLEEAERRIILATLERLGGDKLAAANRLGISLKTLYARLKVYQAAGPPPAPADEDGSHPSPGIP